MANATKGNSKAKSRSVAHLRSESYRRIGRAAKAKGIAIVDAIDAMTLAWESLTPKQQSDILEQQIKHRPTRFKVLS